MAPALVLSEEKAAEAGLTSPGPFAFGGFPGVYFVGIPVEVSELGLEPDESIFAVVDEAGVPLEVTEVAEGEGKAYRPNHGLSEREARVERATAVIEKVAGASIRSHAEADEIAATLGITFGDDTKLADKVAAIETVKAGGTLEAAQEQAEDATEEEAETSTEGET